ncbi:MAG TPA: hypothetical protein VGR62_10285 [Candidatus Binatia bacterium]|jgi:hypothetical protein|nr:hypothetical protein [Candidatus Binatia bacterium]
MTFPRSLVLLALLAACGGSDSERAAAPAPANPAAAPAPAAAPPATLPSNARTLTPEQRAGMLDILKAEAGTEKKAWFTVGPGNPETQNLKSQFEAIFKEAGWETSTQTLTGMMLKPGVMMLIGDEQGPPYADTAQKALEASGLEVKTASGYRPYFEEKKKENIAWVGIPMGPDQAYTIVIGPLPPS